MTSSIKAVTASLSSAQPVTGAQADPQTDPKIWKAATDFESMTIDQLLQPMFNTVDLSKNEFGGGVGESSFRPMMITETAKQIEKSGGLGLAKSVYRQMLEIQEKAG